MLDGLAQGESTTALVATRDGREVAIASRALAGGGWVVTHEDVTERRRVEANTRIWPCTTR